GDDEWADAGTSFASCAGAADCCVSTGAGASAALIGAASGAWTGAPAGRAAGDGAALGTATAGAAAGTAASGRGAWRPSIHSSTPTATMAPRPIVIPICTARQSLGAANW